jgi:hypothetical protein
MFWRSKMIKFVKTAAMGAVAAVALTLSTAGAQATPVAYASGSSDIVKTGSVAADRANIANAYGASDGKFYSLTLGGSAVFTFLPTVYFQSPGSVVEVTFGARTGYLESMDLYGILAGIPTLIGSVTNDMAEAVFTFTGKFDALKVVDTSEVVKGRDGFDIDSISVTPAPIPLPAGGLLLLGALGGVAALRRRKAV